MLADSSFIAAFSVSADGFITAANRKLAALLGARSPDELIGQVLTELETGRRDWGAWRRACLAGRERGVKLTFEGGDGRRVVLRGDLGPAADGASPGSLAGVFVDISEEEQLRRAVQRSARMEALGSLTSGIAHDFNNLLTVLVGNLYLAAEELREDQNAFAKVKIARDAAKRGAELIRQLLAFARRETLDVDVVDPSKVVEGLAPLLRRALGSRITLEAKLRPDTGLTRCSAAQLESAIVNLAVNARDAMEAGGRIVILLESEKLDADVAARRGLSPGEYVKVSVADNGAGIPPEVLEHVFQPFFSTKTERGGTGLGLSMVRWFAEQSGGAVQLRSAVGKGTSVSLLLPRSADATAETAAKTMPLSTLPGGDETVLVVAREESMRSMIKQILDVLGYDVHMSNEPEEALGVLRSRQIDLLLVDAAGQQGAAREQLLQGALKARPSLKIVLTVDGASSKGANTTASTLGKPFSIADLAGTVRRALDAESGGS